jgi:hypothetical protein
MAYFYSWGAVRLASVDSAAVNGVPAPAEIME